ncbi:MAG: 30S ribosomal protein S12 methylthiotransferase RimO [Clostridiales bacterium]|nr:30S ribosomal protein S12 methylthiotransferase RimO [Clostridiales bacterium]
MNKYKVGIISLGCPKNQVDGEIMLSKLAKAGFETVLSPEDADLMIINTCGFIDSAKTEAIETILEMAQYKVAGIISAIVVTGCLAERYKDEVIKEIPEIDAVIGIGANNDIVKVCQKALCGFTTNFFPNECYLPLSGERLLTTPKYMAYLKLSDGCNNRCSFCAIPLIRGKYRERSMEDIVSEARALAASGVRELVLVAQDTTRYGKERYGKYMLAALLKKLCEIDEIKWIRLYYCYPERVTQELIDVIAAEEKVCSYIDIPMQHCSEKVLRAMHRAGNRDSLHALISKLRSEIPGVAIRTTLMVGFPGESAQDFEQLCNFVKEMEFDKMGCFAYSPEEGTPAYSFENQIEDGVKARRAEILGEIQYGVTQKINSRRCGEIYETIVEEFDGEQYTGRAYFDSPDIDSSITFTSETALEAGQFVKVKITGYDGYDLFGKAIGG